MGSHPFAYAKKYLRAHRTHQKWFSGNIGIEGADAIAELVEATHARRILDYGSGKGYQYLVRRVHERWGILPHCYDIGVWQLRARPEGQFDGIICTDVMEHIAETDIKDVLDDLFGFLHGDRPVFAYFNVFCNEASKSFPDGTNVHLTIKPPRWWARRFSAYERENLTLRVDYEYNSGDDL